MEKRAEEASILVAGLGGVGGLLAAMLGRRYEKNLSVLARGGRLRELRRKGIVLHSEFYGDSTAHPARIEEDAEKLGEQDYIFVCVKNYSLPELAEQLKPCIGKATILIPVMNGIEPGERLRALLPGARVLDSLIYTVAASEKDFSVSQIGAYTHLYLGSREPEGEMQREAENLCALLLACGFDARCTEKIESEIWQKYILNCGFNTVTARYLIDTGEIRKNESYARDLYLLMQEAEEVALALGIPVPPGTARRKYDYCMEKQADSATSSMKRDVEAHRRTELDAFLGALLRKAERLGKELPTAKRYFEELSRIARTE